jgi:hypothetical protein
MAGEERIPDGGERFGGTRVKVYGCSPGCLLSSLLVSIVLTIVVNLLIRLFS